MRTTLDISEDVFYAAKDYARANKQTMGAVISAWAREKFAASSSPQTTALGSPAALQFAALGLATFPKRDDAGLLSNEAVNQLRAQEGI